MEFVKIKCSKCGYELEIPEETSSVICGSCGEINTTGRLASLLRKQSATASEIKWTGKTPVTKGTAGRGIESRIPAGAKTPDIKPLPSGQDAGRPIPEEEEGYPEQGTATKIITLIFILVPFIAMAVEFFKLPPYALFIAIAAIILIVFLIKKRS